MRQIIVGAQVSMDGVMQAPGGPTEDPTKGFTFGGWAMPYVDHVFGEELDRVFKKCDLLLGRKTYEIFAAYWLYQDDDAPHGGIAKLFNDIKKYAVSRSGEVETSWAGSVLLRDIADVKRLKQEDGPHLVTQGSTALVHALLANDLVDAMSLFTVPVVLGGGKKLFADGSAPHAFKLTRSRVSPHGVIVGHYERVGAITMGDTTRDAPSEREMARRKRMERERSRWADPVDPVPLCPSRRRNHGGHMAMRAKGYDMTNPVSEYKDAMKLLFDEDAEHLVLAEINALRSTCRAAH